MRQHILPAERRSIGTDIFTVERKIYSLSKIELFASKIAALLNRTAARDLYDMYNIVKYGLVEEDEISLLRKCVVFYKLISSEDKVITFDTSVIGKLTKYKIGTDLYPMLRKKEPVDLEAMKQVVEKFIDSVMVLTPGDREYIEKFMQGEYVQELLFDDEQVINRIKNHPMAIWKVNSTKAGK